MALVKSIKNMKNVYDAIVDYIYHNSSYESNDAINNAVKKIEQSNSIEEIFKIPIDNRLYNFNHSLQWLYFICFIINFINDNNIILSVSFNINFSANDAIMYISNIYNGINDMLYKDYFNDSDNE